MCYAPWGCKESDTTTAYYILIHKSESFESFQCNIIYFESVPILHASIHSANLYGHQSCKSDQESCHKIKNLQHKTFVIPVLLINA